MNTFLRHTLALCLPLLLAACGTPPSAGPAPDLRVKLIAFNDFHGALLPSGSWNASDPGKPTGTVAVAAGGAAYLASLVRQLRAENPNHAVVAAGDLIGASPLESALFHDEPSIEALSTLGLEFSAVGNHEFDDGADELLRLQNGGCFPGGRPGADTCIGGVFPGARFAYLSSNVRSKDSGQPLLNAYGIKIFHSKGRAVKLAFVGAGLRETPGLVRPDGTRGLDFGDEAEAANALVPVLRQQGVQTLVLLVHQGGQIAGRYDDPTCPGLSGDIVPLLDRLDPAYQVVISGHTHRAYACWRAGRVLTSAGSFGRLVTDIDLALDPLSGALRSATMRNLIVVNDTIPAPPGYTALGADAAVREGIQRYVQVASPLAARVVGHITADFSNIPGDNGESALGRLVADAQLVATRAAGAELALTNPGGLRQGLKWRPGQGEQPGKVSYGEVFAAQPFGNALVTMDLTGAQILQALEQQFGRSDYPRVLQVSSGFSYSWSGPPGAERVDASSLRLQGRAVDPAAVYRVTVNDFLAGGGDGFPVFRAGRERVGGGQDAEALATYLENHPPLTPDPAPRIRRQP